MAFKILYHNSVGGNANTPVKLFLLHFLKSCYVTKIKCICMSVLWISVTLCWEFTTSPYFKSYSIVCLSRICIFLRYFTLMMNWYFTLMNWNTGVPTLRNWAIHKYIKWSILFLLSKDAVLGEFFVGTIDNKTS